MRTAVVFIVLGILFSAGCSNREVFESIKRSNIQECYTLPVAQQQECIEQADIDYEDYKRQRDDVIAKERREEVGQG